MNRDVSRCNQLNETILQNASRVSAAIKLTKEDSQTIAILRAEVDKTWKLIGQAKDREIQARKIIFDMNNEISHLSNIVDKVSSLNDGEDNSCTKMNEEKAKLDHEIATKSDFVN
jgi:hypothetical protein